MKKIIAILLVLMMSMNILGILAANQDDVIYDNGLMEKWASESNQAITDRTRSPSNPLTAVFDTGPGTYPSISGTHNGTITPNQTIPVQKLYTYYWSGSGGHTEFVRIWSSGVDMSAIWNGYVGDWHNISFPSSFTLEAGKVYNYTIRTGSYPQIIHKTSLNATGGIITCTEFVDANGITYTDWMPAIRLEALVGLPPTAVLLSTPTEITDNSMLLSWSQNADTDFANYTIYQSTASGDIGTAIHTVTTQSTTSYTVTGLLPATTYYFTIRVYDISGLYNDSNQVNGTTLPETQATALTPWQMFRHDARHTGRSPYAGPQENTLKWKYQTGADIHGNPTIASDGTIYVTSDDHYLYAFYENGSVRWKYDIENPSPTAPAIAADGTIYVGSGGSNKIYALNPNGTLKWSYTTDSSTNSAPAVAADGMIYFGSWDTYLYALNSNGTLKWKYKTGGSIQSSPAVDDNGVVYVGSGDMHATTDGKLYAINPNGTLRWFYQTGGNAVTSSPAVSSGGTIYVGSQDGKLYAVKDGVLRWIYSGSLGMSCSPAIGSDGTIYIGDANGTFFAVKPDGALRWSYRTGEDPAQPGMYGVPSSPAIDSTGMVYFGSVDGKLYALSSGGALRWTYKTGGWIYGSPTISSDGTVYFGSFDDFIYAIGKPSGGPYYHQIYSATSTNGISWTANNTMLFDHASVPGAVYFNNKLYVYYVNAADPENEKLSVGISEDKGITFIVHDVQISGSNSPYPVDPNPIVDGNKIRLTYLGNFMQGETNKIVTATSSDGINFTEDGVILTENDVYDPDLFYYDVGGQWVLFVSSGITVGLIKATSSSPTATFTKDTSFSWTAGGISSTHKIGGKYYTYYAGMNGISVAEYSNGILSNMADAIVTNFTGMMADPTVAIFGLNDYKMFFKTMVGGGPGGVPPLFSPDVSANLTALFNEYNGSIPKDALITWLNDTGNQMLAGAVGPTQHKLYAAYSLDGIHVNGTVDENGYTCEYRTFLLPNASVPDAVLSPDNTTVRLYFVDAHPTRKIIKALSLIPGENIITNDLWFLYNEYYIGGTNIFNTAKSTDGENFTFECMRIVGLSEDYMVADPSVVMLENGSYRIYFLYVAKSELPEGQGDPAAAKNHSIGCAYSPDGVNFTFEGICYSGVYGECMSDPEVFKTGEYYRLYLHPDAGIRPFRYINSTDGGRTFTGTVVWIQIEHMWDVAGCGCRIVHTETGYRIFFGWNGSTASAFSSDGINWVFDEMPKVGGRGYMAAVKFKGMYFLYFHA